LRALRQIGQTSSRPPPSACWVGSVGNGGQPSQATPSASWKREPYGLLGQNIVTGLARGSGHAGDEKRDRHPFRVLEPGREVDDDFAVAVSVAVHRALLS